MPGYLVPPPNNAEDIPFSPVGGLEAATVQDAIVELDTDKADTTDAPNAHNTSHATGGTDALSPSDIGAIPSSEKASANGIATLDSNSKIPSTQLPAVAITSAHVVNSEAAMLAITAEEGDVAIRTDLSKSFILSEAPASTLANWKELLTPTDAVLSVDGRTGTVTLSDIYAPLASPTFTGTPAAPTATSGTNTTQVATTAFVQDAIAPLSPTGTVTSFAGSTAPTGWLLCDGSAVSRTTYAGLFSVCGSTYGAGDGSTTFNVPDLRGRFPLGAGTGVGLNASGTGKPAGTNMTARTRGEWGGEETHLLTAGETGFPKHTHGGSTQNNNANHSHSQWSLLTAGSAYNPGGFDNFGAVLRAYPAHYNIYYGGGNTGTQSANHAHSFTTNENTEASAANRHSVINPFVVLNYIIKT